MNTTTTNTPATASEYVGRPHDFDFLVGRWHVANRRLRRRHEGCTEWEHFDAAMQAWSHLEGQVSVDEIAFEGKDFRGCTFRSLDVTTGRWAIHWINSRRGQVEPPVHGGWAGDRGVFGGDDEDDGRPVRVRFLWERLGPYEARWSQDFALAGRDGAPDGPWETNWVMEMRRLPG